MHWASLPIGNDPTGLLAGSAADGKSAELFQLAARLQETSYVAAATGSAFAAAADEHPVVILHAMGRRAAAPCR